MNIPSRDIPGRVNDGYSNKDIRTVDLLVPIVFFILSIEKYSNKIQLSPLIRLHEFIAPIIFEYSWLLQWCGLMVVVVTVATKKIHRRDSTPLKFPATPHSTDHTNQ
jgi:hypothetical protein